MPREKQWGNHCIFYGTKTVFEVGAIRSIKDSRNNTLIERKAQLIAVGDQVSGASDEQEEGSYDTSIGIEFGRFAMHNRAERGKGKSETSVAEQGRAGLRYVGKQCVKSYGQS